MNFMKTKSIQILTVMLVIIISSCGCKKNDSPTSANSEQPVNPKHNYVVILDLSDRLLNEGQVEKDSAIIMATFSQFEKTARSPLIVTSNDRFIVRILPQRGSSLKQEQYENRLIIDLSTFSAANKNTAFVSFKNNLSKTISDLYKEAHIGNSTKNYAGVDIWMFFNNEINSELINDAENKVVILTDGYFDFNDNANVIHNKNQHTSTNFIASLNCKDWQAKAVRDSIGLIPVSITTKASWIISGVHRKNSDPLMAIKLEYFWKKWLIESGATCPRIILDNASSVMVNEFTKL